MIEVLEVRTPTLSELLEFINRMPAEQRKDALYTAGYELKPIPNSADRNMSNNILVEDVRRVTG
ncbi:MAG: hypothetical protein Q4B26_14770 [Eubacteriales bacterium]|nr:hypothetical protein [Eubacteriales bacterium]